MPKRSRRFSQNAETSVAAEPNASSTSKSRCKMVNLQREFQNLQRDLKPFWKMQEKIQNLQRDFKVFFYGFWIDFFSQNAETSVAAEPNASANNQNFIKKIIFFNKNAETSVAAEPNESRKVAKFLKKTVTKYDFATGSSRPLFQPNLTKTLKRRRRHEAFGSTATDVSAFSLQLARKGTENSTLLCNYFLRIYANLLDAFGSAATDVSAFSLIFLMKILLF